jgi:hypothetical protein
LTVVGLTAENPDGLGVVDEHVVDRGEWFHAGDWDEARPQARAGGAGEIGSEGFAGLCER